jgi:hypothetical protein
MFELFHIFEFIKSQLENHQDSLTLIVTVFIAGSALILVNLVTHHLVQRYEVRKSQKDQVNRNLKPLLRATADVISRITEILITQKVSIFQAVALYDPSDEALKNRISALTAETLNRHESTAYRLINFLALSNFFTRETAALTPFARLDRVEFFLQHKIAVGLRGNLYGLHFLNTELQEDLGASYLDCAHRTRATDLTLSCFLSNLKSGHYDSHLYRKALEVFAVTPPFPAQDHIDRGAVEWKHTLVLAHLAIYLIDFYQELAVDPQWEEHRVFLVRLVRQWNADATKHLYLYEFGDLEQDNYLDTFPAPRTSTQSGLHTLFPLHRVGEGLTRGKKWMALNYRGSRFGRRHHPKHISRHGVSIQVGSNEVCRINWTSDLKDVYEDLLHYLRKRLLEP